MLLGFSIGTEMGMFLLLCNLSENSRERNVSTFPGSKGSEEKVGRVVIP